MTGSTSTKTGPGTAFALPTETGVAVGLVSHCDATMGDLIWIATELFDDVPTIGQVEWIDSWRWCTFYRLGSALRRRFVERIGTVSVPTDLQAFPLMRWGSSEQGWTLVRDADADNIDVTSWVATEDWSLPPRMLVTDLMLKEMVETGWTADLDR